MLVRSGYLAAVAVLAQIALPTLAEAGQLRTYYIAAEEVEWDYAPAGRDLMMGQEFSDDQKVFVEPGPNRIGHIYHKMRYFGYADADFNEELPPADPSLGILGPAIRAEVGDRIDVVFKNATTIPVSLHAHGVL
jgi:FtsP/CotA-like multicopper oxidase with cupredoxin domain